MEEFLAGRQDNYLCFMISIAEFRQMALSFPNTEENPHFDRAAFKVTGRRIFATLHEPSVSANLMFTPEIQSAFAGAENGAVYPVPNKWGLKGATTIELKKASKELVMAALEAAYNDVIKSAPAKKKK